MDSAQVYLPSKPLREWIARVGPSIGNWREKLQLDSDSGELKFNGEPSIGNWREKLQLEGGMSQQLG